MRMGGYTEIDKLLEVENLEVSFRTFGGEVQAVRGVSFHLRKGECLAIVGESGCGKSVTAYTLMRLIPIPPGRIKGGSIRFGGQDLTRLSDRQMEKYRGSEMGIIFQDPMTSLNPVFKVGQQIAEVMVKQKKVSRRSAAKRAVEMLQLVGIPDPERRTNQYPHEFSGGMKQRAMIGIALACSPKLLIADEPTTSLDVTIQAQIIDLMRDLQRQMDTAIILITHDLGVVASLADRVLVMYAGKIVESGELDDIFYRPRHPYTWGLLASVPKLDSSKSVPLASIQGTPPDLFKPPQGCAFAPRCEFAMRICHEECPPEFPAGAGHQVACWLEHDMARPVRPEAWSL